MAVVVFGVSVSGCHAKTPSRYLEVTGTGCRSPSCQGHPIPASRDAPNAGSGFWTTVPGLSPGSSRLWLEELITAFVLSSAKLWLSPGWQTASAVWSPTAGPSPLEHPCRDGAEAGSQQSQNPQPRRMRCWHFAGWLGDTLGVSISSSSPKRGRGTVALSP